MREEIKSLIDSDSLPDLLYWNSILNYFEFHRSELELDDLKALAEESERCRIFWNTDHEVIETIYKNGKHVDVPAVRKSLGIAQEEVNPDIMYYYKQVLATEQHKETIELAKQVANMPKDNTPPEKWAHDLAMDIS